MPFPICSAVTSCSVTCMPRATHQPAISAPIVPAPMTWTRLGRQGNSFGACALQQLRQPEHTAQVPRLVRRSSAARTRASRRPSWPPRCRRSARTDRSGGRARDSDPRAPSPSVFWRMRVASRPRAGHIARMALAKPAGFDFLLRSTALRAAQQERAAAVDELIDEAHAARGGSRQHLCRQHCLHGGGRACLPDGARRAVEAGEDAELDLGEAELVPSSRVAMR